MCPDDASQKWWETAEDHRFALEVLQLRQRREMLRFIGKKVRTVDEIANSLGLNRMLANYHLALLEKALVIEHVTNGYTATPTGILYLERVERRNADSE